MLLVRPYENSLEDYAKENNMEYLLEEFSKKNKHNPNELGKGSRIIVWWNCPDCKSEYNMSIGQRTDSKNNCPYCSGKRVNYTNCLWTTHPDIAKLLKNLQRGYELTSGSSKKEWFVCPDCGFEQSKIILNVKRVGFSCSQCSDGISYPEKIFLSILKQTGIEFETQKLFKWSNNKRYDFYIEKLNAIVEINGSQHYEYTGFKRSLSEEQKNDKVKKEMAINNGIENYIVIDARKSELEYIKKNLKESKINNLINLSKINWDICNEFASSNLVKSACILWNQGIRNSTEIGKIMNIHRVTACRYLKKGAEFGWCDYDPKEEMKKARERGGKASGEKVSREIIQYSLDGQIINEWRNIKDAELFYNIPSTNIVKSCKGKRKTAGGFIWMYKEEYIK